VGGRRVSAGAALCRLPRPRLLVLFLAFGYAVSGIIRRSLASGNHRGA
jgi:hypothetical protein